MIELNIDKKLFNESFYPLLFDYSHRWEVYMGSAGSGKSYFIAEKLVIRALSEEIRMLICRKFGTTLRQTVFSNVKDVIKKFQLTQYVKVNETDYRIKFPNGSEMIFSGLDDETKLLSLNDISVIHVEEAFEVEQGIIEQLNLRLRGKAENQQIILSFNPINKQHWLYNFCEVQPPESFIYHHSTFRDNKFLSEEYIKSLKELYTRNPQKARIYCDGEWGQDTDGLVLTNWEECDIDIYELAKKYEHRVGCDLGWTDDTALIESFYNKKGNEIYITREFVGPGYTLDEIYDNIRLMNLTRSKIWFDSAEPRTIEYFKSKNIDAKPCLKGSNSVKSRISFLQNQKIYVDRRCVNMVDSLSNFSYVKDKMTGKYIQDKYEHQFSHCIDGLSYSYSDIYSKKGIRYFDIKF